MTDSLSAIGLPDANVCRTTRQTLDLACRGDAIGDEGAEAALTDARRHLEGCRSCQTAVRRNEQLDRRIGEVCRDVPVPVDLKDRLLVLLTDVKGDPPATTTTGAVQSVPDPRPSRRRWIGRIVTAAICLAVAGGGIWFSTHKSLPKLTLDQWVQLAITEDLSAEGLPILAAHPDGTLPQVPATMVTSFLTEAPREVAEGRGAMHFFQFPARRGRRTVEGRLLVVPVRWVDGRPTATAFLSHPAVYLGPFCASIWVEGEFCYVCLIKGGENELHTLTQGRPVST